MNKIAITLFITFCSLTITYGQVTKGKFIIGGQASYSNTQNKEISNDNGFANFESSTDNNTAVLSIGKAFSDNDVYGVSFGFLPYSNSTTIYIGGYSSTGSENSYSVSVFNRKYKKLISDLYLFNEVGVGYSYSHVGNVGINWGFLYFTPGVSYRIRKRVDLELLLPNLAKLSYLKRTFTNNFGTYSNNQNYQYLGLNTSQGLSSFAVGIRFIL